jgi:hypothetical protein
MEAIANRETTLRIGLNLCVQVRNKYAPAMYQQVYAQCCYSLLEDSK